MTYRFVNLPEQKTDALYKALDSLARYKFMMFGYWAAIWVHLNHIDTKKEKNPFADLVKLAKVIKETKFY